MSQATRELNKDKLLPFADALCIPLTVHRGDDGNTYLIGTAERELDLKSLQLKLPIKVRVRESLISNMQEHGYLLAHIVGNLSFLLIGPSSHSGVGGGMKLWILDATRVELPLIPPSEGWSREALYRAALPGLMAGYEYSIEAGWVPKPEIRKQVDTYLHLRSKGVSSTSAWNQAIGKRSLASHNDTDVGGF